MTRDELKRIAVQCGGDNHPGWPDTAFLERFAAAIRDAALEEAARICSGIAYSDLLKSEVGECAVAAMRIRALKGKK